MEQEKKLLLLSLSDLFSKKILLYAFSPFLVSMILLAVAFFSLTDITIFGHQDTIAQNESFFAQIMDLSFIHSFTSWLTSFLIYTFGWFFILYLSIFIATIIIGFLTPFIIEEVQKRHYKEIQMIGYSNTIESIWLTLKWAMIMIGLFILLFPLYFIPGLNLIALHLPMYYFFHKMINYDISSHICSREEAKTIQTNNAMLLKIKTAFLYLVSLIPFAIFLGAIFFVIYLGHTYFMEVKKIRN
ncbi:Probable integral membrane protein Cj1452 [hydrothermal vent metagenome]|uniref:Probable integral membrane protein Cj1452 n=1 Tax=hydrothermal vent metagenome TaxID=652676 RepID=A0A1W1D529_9ZZZZ